MQETRWVESLAEATSWRLRRQCDWTATESELGTPLPADYKELCSRFGPGYFSWFIHVLGDEGSDSLLRCWQSSMLDARARPEAVEAYFSPYGLYGAHGDRGLILWGHSEAQGMFYWLADAAVPPDRWPVIARLRPGGDEQWHRVEMGTAEFVYRVIADPTFHPFSVAHLMPFEPAS